MYRINRACKYYPCHDTDKLQSCTFCYCWLYPCEDETKGKWLISKNRLGKGLGRKTYTRKIWDCSNCTYPHNKERIDKIYDFLKNNFKE